jgi:hypothetical protein
MNLEKKERVIRRKEENEERRLSRLLRKTVHHHLIVPKLLLLKVLTLFLLSSGNVRAQQSHHQLQHIKNRIEHNVISEELGTEEVMQLLKQKRKEIDQLLTQNKHFHALRDIAVFIDAEKALGNTILVAELEKLSDSIQEDFAVQAVQRKHSYGIYALDHEIVIVVRGHFNKSVATSKAKLGLGQYIQVKVSGIRPEEFSMNEPSGIEFLSETYDEHTKEIVYVFWVSQKKHPVKHKDKPKMYVVKSRGLQSF